MYSFFKNTGIQFFGDKSNNFTSDLDNNKCYGLDPSKCSSYQFAKEVFKGEWLPLSLDGQRNLIRVSFSFSSTIDRAVFAIDTTISSDPAQRMHFLHESDIAKALESLDDRIDSDKNAFIANGASFFADSDTFNTTEWLKSIELRKLPNMEKKMKAIYLESHSGDSMDLSDSEGQSFDIQAAYLLLIWNFFHGGLDGSTGERRRKLPEVKILGDAEASEDMIDTSLIFDFGNSRSIGLLVEKDLETHSVNIKNSVPLKVINFKKLVEDGPDYINSKSSLSDYLISSKVKFKKNMFDPYITTPNFNYPSMVVIGSEADEDRRPAPSDGPSGLSGPKRYLWVSKEQKLYWRFHDSGETIEDRILGHINIEDTDELVRGEEFPIIPPQAPPHPKYPKRAIMIMSMMEIIYQAFCQVNSLHYRENVANPSVRRNLGRIILSFPTAMPVWERERFEIQANKAMKILVRLGVFEEEIEISLGSDEASCSQLAFLYGEAYRFRGNMKKFFNLLSSDGNDNTLSIATIDIGGGTTDLSICEYKLKNPEQLSSSDIDQKLIYSDGIYKAGDDILESLISKIVIPGIRDSVRKSDEDTEDRFQRLFGVGALDNATDRRVDVLNNLFMPIALFYFHLMENNISKPLLENGDPIRKFEDLRSYMRENGLKEIEDFRPDSNGREHYLVENKIFTNNSFANLEIEVLIPTVTELNKVVEESIKQVLLAYSVVINEHSPSFLLLAGKTCSLPIISKILKDQLSLSPSRILPLRDYYIGDWYPFCSQSNPGTISDPKTAVCVGNSIAHYSNLTSLTMNIHNMGADSDYSLFFIGSADAPDPHTKVPSYIHERSITYKDSNGATEIRPVELTSRKNILFRNIDNEQMPANIIYTLEIHKKEDENLIVCDGIPLKVSLDYTNPKKRLSITQVSGKVMVAGTEGSQRDATIEDVVLRGQTMFEEEFYLDNGKFDITIN